MTVSPLQRLGFCNELCGYLFHSIGGFFASKINNVLDED